MRTLGKYRLVEPLASGGMADLWRAEVSGAEGVVKEVALKLVRGEHAEKSAFVKMFVQEARLAARLSHANVVQMFEFGEVEGRYYISMELVRGRHLGQVQERARERGVRLGVARAVHVGAEVAKALAYAHRAADGGRPLGLVHRDVSPHNVLVSFEGEVKLADFGIARAMNLSEATDPGTVKGKLAYMSPEQARGGGAVDARADVFALGVVLWELCTGRRLLARDSDAATLAAVLGDEPLSPPSAWNEEVPEELDRAVLGALERDPERRTRSAQDVATALSAVLLRVARTPDDVDLRAFMQRLFPDEAARASSGATAQEATKVRPAPAAAQPGPAGEAAAASGEESATRTAAAAEGRAGASRWRWRWAAAAAVAAIAAGGGVAWSARGTRAKGGAGVTMSAGATSTSTSSPTSTPTAAPSPTSTATGTSPPASTSTSTPASTSTSTGTATPTSTSTETASSNAPPSQLAAVEEGAPVGRPAAARPVETAHQIGRLQVPRADTGEGILSLDATPWGTIVVDGHVLGESPMECRVRAGRHHVRVDRKNQRGAETVVTVDPGRRTRKLLR
ncbi:MAG TPA: serine/threonine-protein kinase [Anaeromyxobacter sp.]|nr:serine/threonine-protein kinase [Anaeromyxobacter sp.]